MPAIALPLFFYFLLPRGLTSWCSCRASPLLHQSFAKGFLSLLSTSLPLLGFVGQHSYYASLFHFPRASSAHLLPLYLFYSHGLFGRSFELPQSNYHIFTFYYFLGYWPLSQPNEFTNSFPGLPQPIYFLFTFYYSHRLIISFFGFHWPIYSFFTSFYSCGPAGQWSCHFSLLGLFPYSLTIFHFSHFLYCWASSAIGPFVKNGHQHMSSKVVSNWISLSLNMRKNNINKEIQ